MLAPPHRAPIYPPPLYGAPVQGTVAFRPPLLDIIWYKTWPVIRSILLGSLMLITSSAIIGLDIANLAIEGKKDFQDRTDAGLGTSTAKVGAGIWTGSIAFITAISILVIIFVNNKRLAATIALIAVTLTFFFSIVLIGLTANAIQIDSYPRSEGVLERTQYRLIIAILSLALFTLTLCLLFFITYICVFFSSHTRRSTKY